MNFQDYVLVLNEKKDDDISSALKGGNLEVLSSKVDSIQNNIHQKLKKLRLDLENIKAKQGLKKELAKLIDDGNTSEEAWNILAQTTKDEIESLVKYSEELEAKNTKLDAKINSMRSSISKIKSKEIGKKEIAKLVDDGKTEDEAWKELLKNNIDKLKELVLVKNNIVDDIVVVRKTNDIQSISNTNLTMSSNYLNSTSYLWTHPTNPRGISLEGGVRVAIGKPASKLSYIVTNKGFESEDNNAISNLIKSAVKKIEEAQLKIATNISILFDKKGLKYYTPEEIETFKTVKTLTKEIEKEREAMWDDELADLFDTIGKEEPKPEVKEEPKEKPKKEVKKEEKKKEEKSIKDLSDDELADLF